MKTKFIILIFFIGFALSSFGEEQPAEATTDYSILEGIIQSLNGDQHILHPQRKYAASISWANYYGYGDIDNVEYVLEVSPSDWTDVLVV